MKWSHFGLVDFSLIIVVVSHILRLVNCETLLQTVTDVIGAENYTYYRITRHGNLRLQLDSLTGDADLYMSDKTLRPTYENYELQSITCGSDVLEITQSYNRPVGVAIYGYPSQSETRYKLSVYFISDEDQQDYNYYDAIFNAYPNENSRQYQQPPKYKPSPAPAQEEENESILWTIIMTILKVIFEILL